MRRPPLAVEPLEARTTPTGLDPAFGDGGRLRVPIDQPGSNRFDEVRDVAALPDGRVLFVGRAQGDQIYDPVHSYQTVVGRLTPDGRLDPTFDGDGYAVLDRWTFQARLAPLPDGGAVVAGGRWVARLTGDGALDPTFDGDGVRELDLPYFTDPARLGEVTAVAVAPGGAVFLAGSVVSDLPPYHVTSDFGVMKLAADGSTDETFGPGGLRTVGFPHPGGFNFDTPAEVAVLPDGRVVLAGVTVAGPLDGPYPPNGLAFAAARLTADGLPDPTFGDDGVFTTDFPGAAAAELSALAVLPDGRLLLAGRTSRLDPMLIGSASEYAVARVTADGRLDSSFGGDGRVTVGGPDSFQFGDVAEVGVTPDGKVVLVGNAGRRDPAQLNPEYRAAAVRLTADGEPDPSFGRNGLFAFPFVDPPAGVMLDLVTAGAVLADGRVLLAGDIGAPAPGWDRDLGFAVLLAEPGSDSLDLSYPAEWDSIYTLPGVPPAGPPVEPPVPVYPPIGEVPVVPLPELPAPPPPLRLPTVPVPYDDGAVVGDVTGDGVADVLTTAGPTGSLLQVIDGSNGAERVAFAPFEAGFAGRLHLAAADLDGDGLAEVFAAAGSGGAARVVMFHGADLAAGDTTRPVTFFGIADLAFRGGAVVTTADLSGDGVPDLIVAAGRGGGPRVAVWDGQSVLDGRPAARADLFVFEPTFLGGVSVAAGDTNGDGLAELTVGAGPGGAARVRSVGGRELLAAGPVATLDAVPAGAADFFAFDPAARAGVRVELHDLDGDGSDELFAGCAGSPVRVYAALTAAGEAAAPVPDLELAADALPAGVLVEPHPGP
jgi:uncharacterized delta-60 repeat protein